MLIKFLIALCITTILLLVYCYSAYRVTIKNARWHRLMSMVSLKDRIKLVDAEETEMNDNANPQASMGEVIRKIQLSDKVRIKIK